MRGNQIYLRILVVHSIIFLPSGFSYFSLVVCVAAQLMGSAQLDSDFGEFHLSLQIGQLLENIL